MPSPPRTLTALLVTPDREAARLLREVAGSLGCDVVEAAPGGDESALAGEGTPDVAVVDLAAPDAVAILEALHERVPGASILLLVAAEEPFGELGPGIGDAIRKPLREGELRYRLGRLCEQQAAVPAARPPGPPGPDDEVMLLGESAPIRALRRQIEILAASDAVVLICGESGTHREAIARAIHRRSSRRERPFRAVSAHRLADDPISARARTHAEARPSSPAFPRPERGTLYVHEVGELAAARQDLLLELLAEESAADAHLTVAGTRLIAGTRLDLARQVQEGHFREELYFRIHALVLTVPPLRERGEDVLLLARHVAARTALTLGRTAPELTAAAAAELLAHAWPGNVRELERRVARALLVCDLHLDREHLELDSAAGPLLPYRLAKRDAVERFERDYASRALALTRGNVSAAARLAGKDRKDFWSIVKKHGLGSSRRAPAAASPATSATRP